MKAKSVLSCLLVAAMLFTKMPLVFADEKIEEETPIVGIEEGVENEGIGSEGNSVYDVEDDTDIVDVETPIEEEEEVPEPIIPCIYELPIPLLLKLKPDGKAITASDSVDNHTGQDLRFLGLVIEPLNGWVAENEETDFFNYKANKRGFRLTVNDEVISETSEVINPYGDVALLDGESYPLEVAVELGPWDTPITEEMFTLTLYFEEIIPEPIETLPPVETIPPIEIVPPTETTPPAEVPPSEIVPPTEVETPPVEEKVENGEKPADGDIEGEEPKQEGTDNSDVEVEKPKGEDLSVEDSENKGVEGNGDTSPEEDNEDVGEGNEGSIENNPVEPETPSEDSPEDNTEGVEEEKEGIVEELPVKPTEVIEKKEDSVVEDDLVVAEDSLQKVES